MIKKEIKNKETALIIGVLFKGVFKEKLSDQLNELELLAETAGAKVVSKLIQSRVKPDPATFIGKGKVRIIIDQANELRCSLILFNDDITATQLKNLQKKAGEEIKILDRTGLILDIFSKHAKSKEAKTQVELAQLEYFLPRLTRIWTHLERQMGGIGTRAGAGETQIEVDRRLVRNKITKLKSELKKIHKQRTTQNKFRSKTYRIALIGYTNAGKSTLMNILTNSNALAEDKLFATLDTTTRKLPLKTSIPVLISDTVGFIRNLPHNLIASFRSTLGEIQDVDLLIKVIDVNSNDIHEHIATINEVLNEININKKQSLLVFNKIDKLNDQNIINGLKERFKKSLFVSSINNIGTDKLIKEVENIITTNYTKMEFHINYNQAKYLNIIYKLTNVLKKTSVENGMKLKVEGNNESLEKIRRIIDAK